MTLVPLRGRPAAVMIIAAGPGLDTGTSHIHPFGVTRRECGLAKLNAER